MKQRAAIQTPKQALPLQTRGLLRRAAVRVLSGHELLENSSSGSNFSHDFSQIEAYPSMPIVRQNYSNVSGPPQVQTKLKIGKPGDKYEQEADQIAEQVMRMPEPRGYSSADGSSLKNSANSGSSTIQHVCAPCSAEYKAAKDEGRSVEPANFCPKCQTQENGFIQAKITGDVTPEATPKISAGIQSLQGGGQPLSKSERSFFEPRFGADFSDVRIHNDIRSAGVAQSVGARAFTLGKDIVFGAGEYSSNGLAGRKLLAHELTHTIQQAGKRDLIQRLDGDPTHVELTYNNGVNETRSILRVCDNGIIHFSPHGSTHISNFSAIRHDNGTLSSVTPDALEALYQAIEMRPVACPEARGIACSCEPSTNVVYDSRVMRFIRSIKRFIQAQATRKGVPPTAIAGAIADEYRTRELPRSVVDSIQDAILDNLAEWMIDIDRFFDFDSKLLNTMENDVGPANINVRTATQMVGAEGLVVPNSPLNNVQVSAIIDFLLTNAGTVEATAVIIRRAKNRFDPYLWGYPPNKYDSILVEYFKQGDSYYRRAVAAVGANANHQLCPGSGGCRVIYNYTRLSRAIV